MIPYNFPDIWGVSSHSTFTEKGTYNIAQKLPHGSGIDGDWTIEEKGNKIYAYNSYHCMDEYGGYCGWQDFYIVMTKNNPKNFKLHFQGNQYLAQKYMLRDYLEDAISMSLEGI